MITCPVPSLDSVPCHVVFNIPFLCYLFHDVILSSLLLSFPLPSIPSPLLPLPSPPSPPSPPLIYCQQCLLKIDVDSPCNGIGYAQWWGGQVVSPGVRVDTPFKVTVARQQTNSNEITLEGKREGGRVVKLAFLMASEAISIMISPPFMNSRSIPCCGREIPRGFPTSPYPPISPYMYADHSGMT